MYPVSKGPMPFKIFKKSFPCILVRVTVLPWSHLEMISSWIHILTWGGRYSGDHQLGLVSIWYVIWGGKALEDRSALGDWMECLYRSGDVFVEITGIVLWNSGIVLVAFQIGSAIAEWWNVKGSPPHSLSNGIYKRSVRSRREDIIYNSDRVINPSRAL